MEKHVTSNNHGKKATFKLQSSAAFEQQSHQILSPTKKMKHCVIFMLISVSFFLSAAWAIPINQGDHETYLTAEVMTALQQLFNQKVY